MVSHRCFSLTRGASATRSGGRRSTIWYGDSRRRSSGGDGSERPSSLRLFSTTPSIGNEYVDGLVHHIIMERGLHNCSVVEVGGGKGLFLRKFVEFENAVIAGRLEASRTVAERALVQIGR